MPHSDMQTIHRSPSCPHTRIYLDARASGAAGVVVTCFKPKDHLSSHEGQIHMPDGDYRGTMTW